VAGWLWWLAVEKSSLVQAVAGKFVKLLSRFKQDRVKILANRSRAAFMRGSFSTAIITV
jgi:hypothetical protein